MNKLLIGNVFLFFHLSRIWAQVDNNFILSKLRYIENDTAAFINLINQPYSKKGTYNEALEDIAYSVKHKTDSLSLKKVYKKIINENDIAFNQEKIIEAITYHTSYHGADAIIDLLFIKTNKRYYGFYISHDYYDKTENHYKKILDKKFYKYVSLTMKKSHNKEGDGDPVVMRKLIPHEETIAKIIVMDVKTEKEEGTSKTIFAKLYH